LSIRLRYASFPAGIPKGPTLAGLPSFTKLSLRSLAMFSRSPALMYPIKAKTSLRCVETISALGVEHLGGSEQPKSENTHDFIDHGWAFTHVNVK